MIITSLGLLLCLPFARDLNVLARSELAGGCLLALADTAAQGEIRLGDELLSTLPRRTIAQKIGVLLQADNDAFPGTVMETLLSGRHPWLGQWQMGRRKRPKTGIGCTP